MFSILKHNGLVGCDYYEPYAGGAGLAIRLLAAGAVRRIFINDNDPAVAAFWLAVMSEPEAFCQKLTQTPVTIDEWYRQKDVWRRADPEDVLTLGFATFFLNRTNRSGIIDGAGPVGGFSQAGEWKIDARFDKERQIKNILSLSRFARSVVVSSEDAITFVEKRMGGDHEVYYLDPPYYVKGKKLYKNSYVHADHLSIASHLMAHRNTNWILTYDDTAAIRDAYKPLAPIRYTVTYSAGPAATGIEIMYTSDTVALPSRAELISIP